MSQLRYDKPLPDTTGINAPYWQGTMLGQLRLQHCRDCGTYWHPATEFCPGCLAANYEWSPAAGTGTIFARIFMHQVYWPAFADDVPYNIVWVQLDEGPMITANVVGSPRDDIEVGRRVEVVFDAVTPDLTLPRFRVV